MKKDHVLIVFNNKKERQYFGEVYIPNEGHAHCIIKVNEPAPEEVSNTIRERLHLCMFCQHQYPACEGKPKFGTGKGKDNIFDCNAFLPIAERPTVLLQGKIGQTQEGKDIEELAEMLGRLARRVEILEGDKPVKSISEIKSEFEDMKIKRVHSAEKRLLQRAYFTIVKAHPFINKKLALDIDSEMQDLILDIEEWRKQR
jgi:hypothetical protein